MARRISRPSGTTQPKAPKQKRTSAAQKRSLNAFSLAGAEEAEDVRIPAHRLGQLEDDEARHPKRRRIEDEEEDDESEKEQARRERYGSISEGEDSEGNTWKMGYVSADDDSEIDSDEAFGESDEERFADFTFRASSKNRKRPQKKARDEKDINLDEDDEQMGSDSDDSSLGEDAVDLATMLDNYKEGSDSEDDESAGSGDEESEGSDDASSEDEDSDAEEDEDQDKEKITQLHDLISSMQPQEMSKSKQSRGVDRYEHQPMSAFGITANKKLTIDDLLPTIADPAMRKSLKSMAKDKPAKGALGKLEAPLPKRKQDHMDRVAANEKAKETLDRWVETVKQNRRAEHLQFPLRDPNASEPFGKTKLLPADATTPLNDLESTVQNILRESGLVSADGKADEEAIKHFEELQEKKMSVDEVLAARADLRRQRDLLFREEIKAKRLKKIKSKSFRRVHRKDRERAAQQEKDALAAAGLYDSDEDRDKNDRRRAEERMGAKHRESKWAKAMKESGRSVWDEDARGGIVEMARRNEELRRRIEGKTIHDEASDIGSEFDDDEDDDSDDDETARKKINSTLSRLQDADRDAGSGSTLGSLKFMQRAEAAKKAENDAAIAELRKELDGDSGSSDSDAEAGPSAGRMKFGPASEIAPGVILKSQRNEFEEPDASDQEKEQGQTDDVVVTEKRQKKGSRAQPLRNAAKEKPEKHDYVELVVEDNPWAPTVAPGKGKKSKSTSSAEKMGPSTDVLLPTPNGSKPKATANGARPTRTKEAVDIRLTEDANESDSSDDGLTDAMKRNHALVQQAFAGTDLAEDFSKEKQTTIADEDDKVVDNTLPGWGNWAGEGVSKREKAKGKGRFLTKVEGIRPEARKDARLKNVIVNEKRVKKNAAYLASTLPFPFTDRDEYERSIRMPMGREWSMDKPKPRVMVKPGKVIAPLEKPLL
ncbi:Utp14-domain-containing protein [Eremomyces bilateralis CBS 781.70]|uniref:Utp14-domain-containing protein n=1 Tax=Eremomyces bilateralis CBS 781.70 TaxID=1392243 RepID=A0A6G1G781_9PEZI|nr:Utp14-domain-containing protein [Eremomyces bilateralis CBS 781.70]KAF1813945.1 Utp14-domain-containing protein [Eremomyces bilateralis CBS 781.70]